MELYHKGWHFVLVSELLAKYNDEQTKSISYNVKGSKLNHIIDFEDARNKKQEIEENYKEEKPEAEGDSAPGE